MLCENESASSVGSWPVCFLILIDPDDALELDAVHGGGQGHGAGGTAGDGGTADGSHAVNAHRPDDLGNLAGAVLDGELEALTHGQGHIGVGDLPVLAAGLGLAAVAGAALVGLDVGADDALGLLALVLGGDGDGALGNAGDNTLAVDSGNGGITGSPGHIGAADGLVAQLHTDGKLLALGVEGNIGMIQNQLSGNHLLGLGGSGGCGRCGGFGGAVVSG